MRGARTPPFRATMINRRCVMSKRTKEAVARRRAEGWSFRKIEKKYGIGNGNGTAAMRIARGATK